MRKFPVVILLLLGLGAVSAAQAIIDGVEDTGDQIRAVVNINGCSGTLISDRIVLTAAHCYGREVTGCRTPYNPKQANVPPGPPIGADRVRVPPLGETVINTPGGTDYFIEGFRVMPGYTWDIVDTCCGGNLNTCDFCPDDADYAYTNFANAGVTTQVHDIALVYLDRPVVGITPEEVLFEVGPQAQYPVDPANLVGTNVIIAGTSRVALPSPATRAFGVAELTGLADSDTVAEEEPICSLEGQSIVTYAGPSSTFQYQPANTATACWVPGDSGGPNFVNAVGLGGDSVPGIPAGKRLVAAVVSGGNGKSTTDSCDSVTHMQAALTYNFEYTYDGNPVIAQNGDFIRNAIDDFDGDGIANDQDNCPTVINYDQANCNSDAEKAKGFEELGDLCDPIPCAYARPEPPKLEVTSSIDNSFLKAVNGTMVRQDFELDPRPSHRFFNGSNNGDDTGSLTVDQVPTKYRFCQIDPAKFVNCNNQTIDNGYASMPNGEIGAARPYLHASMKTLQGTGPTFDQEPFDHGTTPPTLRRWDYATDSNLWQNNGWITPVGNGWPSPGLDGRYWVHSDTDVGRYTYPPGATGYPEKLDGTASADDTHLSNHYLWHNPDSPFSIFYTKRLILWPYFDWKIDWELAGSIGPIWGGEYLEDAKVVRSEGDYYALVTPEGNGLVIDEFLGDGLKERLGDEGLIWVSAAEASADQTHVKSSESPHAVAFAPGGTNIVDGVYRDASRAGNTADMGVASLSRRDGPSERSNFVGVYSRADDLAFVVGDGEVWFRSVVGDRPWQLSPRSERYQPETILAATWSFRDQKLWILDTVDGIARLTRLHPFTGFSERVSEWEFSGRFDQQWLRVTLDGNVLLFSSSTEAETHGIALFHSEGMKAGAPVTVAALHLNDRNLLYEPTVDRGGVSLTLAAERGGIQRLRHNTVPGRATAMESLASLFE